ncbi:anaerobic ribonucleoside triphosphate reductase [Ruminococcaceae bacterium OttesenSCG-928-A16]|nr:anaerobic ribonucleoside triphosphate reductase [Ruminococcaceae bacterium OttesenSCG-928-A16]
MQKTGVRTITKRDGREVLYDETKIAKAILKALVATGKEDVPLAAQIANEVGAALSAKNSGQSYLIEDVQDEVEKALMRAGYEDAAKSYILYRAQRTNVREANTSLMKAFDEITNADARQSDLKRDNANVDGNTAMGSMLQIGSAAAKAYNSAYLVTKQHAQAHTEGAIHIHDFDFYSLTTTCCQIDLDQLFSGGFSTGHGFLREPQDIQSYAALACIAIQSNQNDQHGGQSVPNFDYALGKGVAKTYRRLFTENLLKALELLAPDKEWSKDQAKLLVALAEEKAGTGPKLALDETYLASLREVLLPMVSAEAADQILAFLPNTTEKETDRRTYQAMEAVIHNLNSMHSRAGAQTPFSSINYGTDTSPEGRMVMKNVMLATEAGLGHSETPIFPIQIFKLKAGVNYNPEDPNYDLFELACRCSAKRLFPNFTNLDAPYNLQYYKPGRPETEIATMGCRTRVMANVYDPTRQTAFGRGNLSFTSINLPRLGIEAKGDETKFYQDLDNVLELVSAQLLDRFEIQAKKSVRNFPFLMGQGVWMDSETLGPDDEIREVLKHGTLSIGFIGLAETLKALYGHHHGESDEMQQKGLAIVSHMNDFCAKKSKEKGMNFTLLATPAEGLSGRFVKIDRKKYGSLPGITDRDYYTNSFHVPVYHPISAYDKIQKEAPYHALTPAGHITYVELDGDTADNLEAFMAIVRCMHDAGVGYGSINHPVDRDPVCGYVGIIDEVCPRCGRRAGEPIAPDKLDELRRQYPQITEFCGCH